MATFKSEKMNINFKEAVSYLTFKNLEKYNFFKHAYSTRLGGVSDGEFKSLNLGFKTLDKKENIHKNFDIFCNAFGVKKERMAITSQIHSDKIVCVKKDNIQNFTQFSDTDGLITNEPGICLTTFHADCLTIYMVDVKNKVIGLAHAGWRGTVKNIASKLANKFVEEYGSLKENIICALGPGIGVCCFEVSGDVLEKFKSLDIPKTYILGKNKIDLAQVNKEFLIQFGISEKNIFKSDICTMCNKDMLFSHRATSGKRGLNCAFISIKKEVEICGKNRK